MMRRSLIAIAVAAVLMLVGGGLVVWQLGLFRQEGAIAIGGPFSLVTKGGERVTDRDLLGRPVAIFFGYTHCPDVCPTTLAEMDAARAEIGPESDRLQVVFVSVDPERDTPDELAAYVGSFQHPVLGLTGTADEIAAITRAYRVVYEKVPGTDGDYTINHTATVYLMDAAGTFAGTISYFEDHASRIAKLRRLMGLTG